MPLQPPVIFLAFARSNSQLYAELPRLPDESRLLRRSFEDAGSGYRLIVRENATLDDVLEVFQDRRYYGRIALFHFAGHADAYRLLLEDAEHKPMLVDAGGLAQFLGRQPALDLVVLNACSTAAHAPALHQAGVPRVVATDDVIADDLALPFSDHLYAALLAGATLENAIETAKGAVRAIASGTPLAASPICWRLHLAAPADAGWKLEPATYEQEKTASEPEPSVAAPLPPGPHTLFVGRQAELRKLDDWLEGVERTLTGKLVVVYGPSGNGKRELVRHWLADVRRRPHPPLIARTTFRPDDIAAHAAVDSYARHTLLTLDWPRLGPAVATALPQVFRSANYQWVALAAQIIGGSTPVQQTLAQGPRWAVDLRLDSADLPDAGLKNLVRTAVANGRPLVLVLEHAHLAPPSWYHLLEQWETELRHSRLPVLIVLTYDRFEPFTGAHAQHPLPEEHAFLQKLSAAPYSTVGALYLSRLKPADVDALLAPESLPFAAELYNLTEGAPGLIAQLLAHWARLGQAEPQRDGRWRIDPDLPYSTPGSLYDDLVEQPLARCAARAQALGYELTAGHLLEWLNYAVWEGDCFTDAALAHAVGWDGPAMDDFEVVLDEALCDPDDPTGGLVQWVDHAELPPVKGEHAARNRNRYCLAPPLVAAILRQRQPLPDRQARGTEYSQALEHAYWPYRERIVTQLARLFDAIGLPRQAAIYWQLKRTLDRLAELERQLLQADKMAIDRWGQSSLMWQIVEYAQAVYHIRHPKEGLAWLQKALKLSSQLNSARGKAATLNSIGMVYADLGDRQAALRYYEQTLPLFRRVGDKAGEAATLNNIGSVYAALGDQQAALRYYEQTLPLIRQVGDKAGEATTLNNIGRVYADLGDQQTALRYYEQALPLLRQVGDKSGEAGALSNIGTVYAYLGDQQAALRCYEQALPLDRQVGDKSGEATTLNSIGAAYADLGDKRAALRYYEQALPLRRQVRDKSGEATTLNNIGKVYADLGDKQAALRYYEQALRLQR